jgi:hypothetical protein
MVDVRENARLCGRGHAVFRRFATILQGLLGAPYRGPFC